MNYTDINGWFTFEDVYDFVSNKLGENSNFLEIGVFEGKSIIYLAEKVKEKKKKINLFALDSFTGSENDESMKKHACNSVGGNLYLKFLNNLIKCNVANLVTPLIGRSEIVCSVFPDDFFDFIYIDAAHDYDSVKEDLTNWYPKLKINGIIAGHDYVPNSLNNEVVMAVNDFFREKKMKITNWGISWLVTKL
mgnify:CR=1 FL=1